MRVQPSHTKDSRNFAPSVPSALDWWRTPAMASGVVVYERASQICSGLAVEWQAFVGRMNEDLHLWHQLAAARAPDEIWKAWFRFWQRAVENYGAECSVVTKLVAGCVHVGDVVSDEHAKPPQSKAT